MAHPHSSLMMFCAAQMALINSRDPKEKAALQNVADDIQAQRNHKRQHCSKLVPW